MLNNKQMLLNILLDNALMYMSINLNTGYLEILHKRCDFLPQATEWAQTMTLKEFVQQLVQIHWIHPDDVNLFLETFNLTRLRKDFYHHIRDETYYFNSLYQDQYTWICCEILSGKNCSPSGNPTIVVYLKQSTIDEKLHGWKQLEYMSYNDALTGLYNRAKYEQDIKTYDAKNIKIVTCIYMDVVGLHEINNHLGHQAGDNMLITVADALRQYFSSGLLYRIGGDEFVVLYPDIKRSDFNDKLLGLRKKLQTYDYEISIGVCDKQEHEPLMETINEAEKQMRQNKAEFYRRKGNLRQMRTLNVKLEKMLLEKKDATRFLELLAPRFKGVYMVNMVTDEFRYIYIPPYFEEMIARHEGKYLSSLQEYFHVLVKKEWQFVFDTLKDYDYIQEELKKKDVLIYRYQKKDNQWVVLKILPYEWSEATEPETLWIFTNEDK